MECDYRQVIQLFENGDWNTAHQLVQVHSDKLSYLIHGYLHRDESDLGNAAYWYQKAEEPLPDNSLPTELERLKNMIQ